MYFNREKKIRSHGFFKNLYVFSIELRKMFTLAS